MITKILIGLLVSSVISGASVWQVQSWRYGNQIAQIEADQARKDEAAALAFAAAVESVREDERRLFATVQAAEQEARVREQTHRITAAAARRESDSLRDNLAALKAGLPHLTERAVLERASTLSGLLGDCAGDYQRMAETAQRHASDVKTLIDAWPRNPHDPD
jgi:hypothetical protein